MELFPRLLGSAFHQLPAPVQAIHRSRQEYFEGTCDIERGRGLLARVMAAVSRLPPSGKSVKLRIRIQRGPVGETWTRDFGGHAMRSTLRARGVFLEERLGPTRFCFTLVPEAGGIRWDLASVRSLGIPLPVSWFRGVEAREGASGGRYTFDVRAALPVVGLLVHYRGSLDAD
jgi:hypothetical protein